jgi:cellulose synthase/poly-beta-1,6-N-acetylglucosamine synthase-like glycosyltransferase
VYYFCPMWVTALSVLFFLSLAGLLHTYVLYPLVMCAIAGKNRRNTPVFERNDADLPFVTILMSAYNEAQVLPEKLASLAEIDYPAGRFRILIGSDASTDATNQLLRDFQAAHPNYVEVHLFTQRRGKPPVINQLAEIAFQHTPASPRHLLLMTDASVMLEPETLFRLARHFKDPQVGCTDAHMRTRTDGAGVSGSESTYMHRETRLKQCESHAWRMMIGPFGGCYMLRSDLFRPVPPFSLVDDFYLGFGVLEAGFHAINDLEAVCYERPTFHLHEEYRRKKRIATGSMKNLAIYQRHAWSPHTKLGFSFVSHKVLRWFGPILLLIMAMCITLLALQSNVWFWVFIAGSTAFGLVLLGQILEKLTGFRIKILHHLFYFLAMNVALLHGILIYLKGIKTDIWEPTKRT